MLSPDDFAFVQKLVLKHASISLSQGQEYLVKSRLAPLVRQVGLPDIAALVSKLRREPHGTLHASVVEAMTTHETSWFRDHHPYATLKMHILPELIAQRRATRALNVWSAACSTGQEPYSLAMMVRETPELTGWNVRIVATDLSRDAIARAKEGVYSTHELGRGMPERALSRYFDQEGSSFRAKPTLRSLIEWHQLNLAEPLRALPAFDLVFLRNVLIYFSPGTCSAILKNVHDAMSRKGYLILGTAENMLGLSVAFESNMVGRTMVYRPLGAAPPVTAPATATETVKQATRR